MPSLKKKALLVGTHDQELDAVQDFLKKGYLFDIDISHSFADAINGISKKKYDMVLMNLPFLDDAYTAKLIKLNQFLPKMPVLVLARQIAVECYRAISSLKNLVTLQKPFHEEVFKAIIDKVNNDNYIDPSILPRFITNEPVRLMVYRTGLFIPTRMKNYSSGGAFLEYHGITLRVGDRVQLVFNSQAGERNTKEMNFKASIRWIKDGDGGRSPSRGVGIQFLD